MQLSTKMATASSRFQTTNYFEVSVKRIFGEFLVEPISEKTKIATNY